MDKPIPVAVEASRVLVPFGGAVGVSIHYDHAALENVGFSSSRIDFGKNVSNAGSPYVLFGTAATMYFAATLSKKPHLQETGRLGGVAIVDALLLTEGLKLATQHDRPFQGNGHGDFWPHGIQNYGVPFDVRLPVCPPASRVGRHCKLTSHRLLECHCPRKSQLFNTIQLIIFPAFKL